MNETRQARKRRIGPLVWDTLDSRYVRVLRTTADGFLVLGTAGSGRELPDYRHPNQVIRMID